MILCQVSPPFILLGSDSISPPPPPLGERWIPRITLPSPYSPLGRGVGITMLCAVIRRGASPQPIGGRAWGGVRLKFAPLCSPCAPLTPSPHNAPYAQLLCAQRRIRVIMRNCLGVNCPAVGSASLCFAPFKCPNSVRAGKKAGRRKGTVILSVGGRPLPPR